MKYRTKLTSSLILLAVISCSIALIFEYKNIRTSIEHSFENRTKNIALTLSILADPTLTQTFHSSPKENSEEYLALEKQFRRVLKAMRSSGMQVESIFTLAPARDDPERLIIGVDVHSDLTIPSQIGKPWKTEKNIDLWKHLDKPYSPNSFASVHKGIWLNGFAPIKDPAGKYIATIGVTIFSPHLLTLLNQVIEYQIIGVLLSLIVATIGAYFLMRHMTIPLKTLIDGVREIIKGNFSHRIQLKTHDEFYILASSLNKMSKGLSEKKRIKKGFSHHLTYAALSNVIKEPVPMKKIRGKKKVTLLFVRFKDFPQKVDIYEPELFFKLFNETYIKFLSIVFRNQGSLEKFFSDQILVEFGIPLADPEQEENALKTAIEIKKQIRLINQLFGLEETQHLHVHIGIHTGETIVGTIGSSYRKAFTAIGESLNTVTAITAQCAKDDYSLLMSEATASALKEKYPLEEIGTLAEDETKKQITLYTLKDEI